MFNFLKKKKVESIKEFLTKKFEPIAKYAYHGQVLVESCPVVIPNSPGQLFYGVNVVGEKSTQLAHFYIALIDILEWMDKK